MEYKMTYELFVELIIQNIREYLPEELKDAEIVRQTTDKINNKRDGIAFVANQEKGKRLSPNLYLEPFYQRYTEGWTLNEILEGIGHELEQSVREMNGITEKIQLDSIRENIFCKLIHTEQNKELLQKMPHRQFQDLSIVYAWYIGERPDGILSAPVDSRLAEAQGFSEEELYQLAKQNTKRLFPTIIKPMRVMISELFGGREESEGEQFEFLPDDDFPMYVVSNTKKFYGASAVLYEDGIQMLADRLDDNLYLLPSSVNEWIIVPENFANLEQISEIVREVNFSQVELEERLSNEVYHYDKRTRQFTIATDVPDKALTGYVAEEKAVYQADPPRR